MLARPEDGQALDRNGSYKHDSAKGWGDDNVAQAAPGTTWVPEVGLACSQLLRQPPGPAAIQG